MAAQCNPRATARGDFFGALWSEHVPFDQLGQGHTLSLLARFGLRLNVAVQPHQVEQVSRLLEQCQQWDVSVGLWPLLHDEQGRWLNRWNAVAYQAHFHTLLRELRAASLRPAEVIFDLEPPIFAMRSVLSGRLDLRRWVRRWRLQSGSPTILSGLSQAAAQQGMKPVAVVPPFVLCDPPGRVGGWHDLMGLLPLDDYLERVEVMLYTSLMEGYGWGLVGRQQARALLADCCRRAQERWPGRAGVALGVIGGGALGDEQSYRSVDELRDDVAIARALGVTNIALFGLTGLLQQPRPQQWLQTLIETPAAAAPPSLDRRSRALLAGAAGIGLAGALGLERLVRGKALSSAS